MSYVFTIFNHGTNFHRDKNENEVITQLHTAIKGTEAKFTPDGGIRGGGGFGSRANIKPTHLIFEGPGSGEVDEENSSSGQKHAHPGKYNPITNEKKGKATENLGLTPAGEKKLSPSLKFERGNFIPKVGLRKRDYSDFQKSFAGDTNHSSFVEKNIKNQQGLGSLLGTGWNDNIFKAITMISHLDGLGIKPDVINLVGWSRGGVTCLKMANKIYEVYGDSIKLNIFAIDPVIGGPTESKEDTWTIPPNVSNYLAILALDDDRATFQPTDLTVLKIQNPGGDKEIPNVLFLPLPGNHSQVVNLKHKGGATSYSGILSGHLAWKFLSTHGSEFEDAYVRKNRWMLTPNEIPVIYQSLGSHMKTVAKKSSSGAFSGAGTIRKVRHVRRKRHMYVRGSDYFMNEHHRMCFFQRRGKILRAQGNLPKIDTGDLLNRLDEKYSDSQYLPLPYSELDQMGIAY